MAKVDNHSIKNIYYMLSYAFQTLKENGYKNIASEQFNNIHDLFAEILIKGIEMQIKRGLHRDYIEIQDSIPGVRGQICVSETIKRQTQQKGKLVCVYDEFCVNSKHNQILKSVMRLLLNHGDVKTIRKKIIRKLLTYFSHVEDILPIYIRWDTLKYHRNNASYRMILEICRLTIKGLLLTTETGIHKLSSWLQDEEMHRLYEKFVLSYYLKHHPHYMPKASLIEWDVDCSLQSKYLPIMKSDITLSDGVKKLIIDTKYYNKTMQYNEFYDSRKFISNNLYQIYSYVKNSDKNNTGNVAGVLLYAKTDEIVTPDEDIIIGGNKISLKTLDLNCEWSLLVEQLEELCNWFKFS